MMQSLHPESRWSMSISIKGMMRVRDKTEDMESDPALSIQNTASSSSFMGLRVGLTGA